MNKKIFIYFGIIMLISLVSADLIITPNPINVNVQVGDLEEFSLTLNNTYNFDIYDFSFSELDNKGFNFPNFNLSSNESKEIKFNVSSDSSYSGTINSNVKFKFYVNLPLTISNYNITISPELSEGFNPREITIRQGDTITWVNNDNVTHSVYSTEFSTISIPGGSSSSHTFSNLGTFSYKDTFFDTIPYPSLQGTIEVISRTEQYKAHNSEYDEVLAVNFNSVADPTSMSVSNSGDNYEIGYGNYKEGLLTIKNTGSEKAEDVLLTSNYNWVAFEKNNFDINSGGTKWVEYTIFPSMLQTEDTNKTYNVIVSIKASNTEQKNITMSVFIPYKNIDNTLTSDMAMLEYLEEFFCPKYPCSIMCGGVNNPDCISSNSSNSYSNSGNISVNISSENFYNLVKDISTIKDDNTRMSNLIKQFQDTYGLDLEEIQKIVNNSYSLQKENESDNSGLKATIWIIGSFLFIGGVATYLIKTFKKNQERESLLSRFHKYKKEND
jgi:plastocyanin